MDLVLFNFVFGFESECLNVGTYVVHLFLGHMDFEFVKPCWLVLLNYCCCVYIGMDMHLFSRHVNFEFVTPCWSMLLNYCCCVYMEWACISSRDM